MTGKKSHVLACTSSVTSKIVTSLLSSHLHIFSALLFTSCFFLVRRPCLMLDYKQMPKVCCVLFRHSWLIRARFLHVCHITLTRWLCAVHVFWWLLAPSTYLYVLSSIFCTAERTHNYWRLCGHEFTVRCRPPSEIL